MILAIIFHVIDFEFIDCSNIQRPIIRRRQCYSLRYTLSGLTLEHANLSIEHEAWS